MSAPTIAPAAETAAQVPAGFTTDPCADCGTHVAVMRVAHPLTGVERPVCGWCHPQAVAVRRENEQRRTVVAALRELADLLEGSPWLAVPSFGGLQACVKLGRPQGERFAAVRAVADHLGVDVTESERGSRRAGKFFGPIEYYVHANADDYDGEARYVERVVPADEDTGLLAGTAVAS